MIRVTVEVRGKMAAVADISPVHVKPGCRATDFNFAFGETSDCPAGMKTGTGHVVGYEGDSIWGLIAKVAGIANVACEVGMIDPRKTVTSSNETPVVPRSDAEVQRAEPILQFFAFAHLPEHLQAVSRPFGELANSLVLDLPRNPERTVALRKLLEAKDAAVRALLFTEV